MAGGLNTGISTFQGVLFGSSLGIALLGGGGVFFQPSMPKGYTATSWKIKKFLDSLTLGIVGLVGGGLCGLMWARSPHLQLTSLHSNIILYSLIGLGTYNTTFYLTKPILKQDAAKISFAASVATVSAAMYR